MFATSREGKGNRRNSLLIKRRKKRKMPPGHGQHRPRLHHSSSATTFLSETKKGALARPPRPLGAFIADLRRPPLPDSPRHRRLPPRLHLGKQQHQGTISPLAPLLLRTQGIRAKISALEPPNRLGFCPFGASCRPRSRLIRPAGGGGEEGPWVEENM